MALYTDTVMDHFMNPRNVGEIADADGVGEVGNAKCGDIMKMYLKIKDNRIEDVKFETFGCGSAIASSSMATEMVKGKTVDEALARTSRSLTRSADCRRTSCTAAFWPRSPSRRRSRTITTRTASNTTTPSSLTAGAVRAAATWCKQEKKALRTVFCGSERFFNGFRSRPYRAESTRTGSRRHCICYLGRGRWHH